MSTIFKTDKFNLTDGDKVFIEEKVGKISHLLSGEDIYVKIVEDRHKSYKLEISLSLGKVHIRASKSGSKFYDLVEDAVQALKSRITSFKEKSRYYFNGDKNWDDLSVGYDIEDDHKEDYTFGFRPIVKIKTYEDDTPIHPQEAIERMSLLDHKAFLFKNIETGRYAMVYIRDDGNYGLVQPPVE